ncbi:MAG: hypothetical protein IKG67_00450 [Parasporobacterium sp.]|nr:hypothetical protein [Parasporobacterium sp.]MBR3400686.1 hypothetical protein [Parasporobacterium sp.]
MTFPNAYHGVKKIFTAQILKIIEGVCVFIAGVAGLIAIAGTVVGAAAEASAEEVPASLEGTLVTFGIIGLVFIVAGGVLSVVSYIMNIVGLRQAGKDEDAFQLGFMFACFAMIIKFVSILFSLLNVGGGIADNIADTVGRICDIVIMISVLNGVANLAERLHNEKLAELAGKLMNTLIVIIGLSAVATVIPAFFGVNEVFMNISSIMNMVAGGLAIIGTIIYLVFLGKGMKMLKEN